MWSVLLSFKLLVVWLFFQQGRTATSLRSPPTDRTVRDGSDVERFDVLVYGANAAGVAAAVTASSGGRFHVKVVEPLTMIGGMAAAGGVSLMNQGRCGLTGLAKNWSILVGEYYGLSDGMPYPPFPRRFFGVFFFGGIDFGDVLKRDHHRFILFCQCLHSNRVPFTHQIISPHLCLTVVVLYVRTLQA